MVSGESVAATPVASTTAATTRQAAVTADSPTRVPRRTRPSLADGAITRAGSSSSSSRPTLQRTKSSDATETQGSIRHLERGGPPLNRSSSGVGKPSTRGGDNRRAMMQGRAMSTRNVGSRPGLGGMNNNRSMSTRFLNAAASALFSSDEPDKEPSTIMYMGREIKVADYFDDDWIEDALDEEASLKSSSANMDGSSSRRMDSSSAARRHLKQNPRKRQELPQGRNRNSLTMQDSSNTSIASNASYRKEGANSSSDSDANDGDSESEIEEDMEDMEQHGSKASQTRPIPMRPQPRGKHPMRAKSSSAASIHRRVKMTRSLTFDGTQTSEILPRRRKAKSDIREVNGEWKRNNSRDDLTKQFQYFLGKMGSQEFGNHTYDTLEPQPREPRPPPRLPKSRKKKQQFRSLEYTAEDIQDVLCDDEDTFQRLKRVLTKKGAVTNGVLQQRLHVFLKKAKDRNSKAAKKQQQDESVDDSDDDDEEDRRDSDTQSADWQAMSMMDLFAKSVRKLTTDTAAGPTNDAAPVSPKPAKGLLDGVEKPWGGAGDGELKPWGGEELKPWGNEPKNTSTSEEPWKRRALPRQLAVLDKKKKAMQDAKKSSRSLMTMMSLSEDEEEESASEEEVEIDDNNTSKTTDMDASRFSRLSEGTEDLNVSGATGMDASPLSTGMDVSRMSNMSHSGHDTRTRSKSPQSPTSSNKPTTPKPTKRVPSRQKSLSKRRGSRRPTSASRNRKTPPSTRRRLQDTLPLVPDSGISQQPRCLDDESTQSQEPMQLDMSSSAISLTDSCVGGLPLTSHSSTKPVQSNRSSENDHSRRPKQIVATGDEQLELNLTRDFYQRKSDATSTNAEETKGEVAPSAQSDAAGLLVGWNH